MNKMKILVVGGGVGGPAFAQFMKDSADVTLIDKAPKWGNIGFMISLWGNGQRVLKALALDTEILKDGYKVPWSALENRKGKFLSFLNFGIFSMYGETVTITRTSLQEGLTKNLTEKVRVKMGTVITAMVQDSAGVEVSMSDNTTERYDLVVGADGIHSQVRDMVFGRDILKYYGWSIYTFWTPQDMQTPKGMVEISGGGKMCIVYPIEDKSVATLFLSTPIKDLAKKYTQNELKEIFKDFEPYVFHLIEKIEDPEHLFKDNLAYVKMKEWYKGRVVLTGDAQHAISPFMGMGASMALEDAFVLAEELRDVNAENISTALKNYQRRRSKRIATLRRVSDTIESWMMVRSSFWAFWRDIFIKIIPTSFFIKPIQRLLDQKI